MKHKHAIIGLLCVIVLLFTGQPVLALVGDIDFNGLVDATDLGIVHNAYASHAYSPASPNWDARADLNLDELVNLKDLVLAGRNFGDTFNFHLPRRVSNGTSNTPTLTKVIEVDAVSGPDGVIHAIWLEDEISDDPLFYQQFDALGNPLIEDIQIDNDAIAIRLAVDVNGDAHIVWRRRYSDGGGYYTRINALGQTQTPPKRFCQNCGTLAVAADAYGNAHILFSESYDHLYYTILDQNGKPFLPKAEINTNYGVVDYSVDSVTIQIDAAGERHIVWHQDVPGSPGGYVYTRIHADGSLAINQLEAAALQGSWNTRRIFIQADTAGALHLVYYDWRHDSANYYWRRVNPDGSLSAEREIVTDAYGDAGMSLPLAIDSSDRLHFIGEDINSRQYYGLLDRDGNLLRPYQPFEFTPATTPILTLDAHGNGALVYGDRTHTSPRPLVIQTTASGPVENDTARADLVLDAALTHNRNLELLDRHLDLENPILRINDNATLYLRLTNGGPAASGEVTVSFQSSLPGLSIVPLTLPGLAAFQYVELTPSFTMPAVEDATLLTLTITAATTSAETSLANNQVVARYQVAPPARTFNLDVTPFDETLTPNPAERAYAAPLREATLTLRGPGGALIETISPAGVFNTFFDVPLDTSDPAGLASGYLTSYTLSLSKAGYATREISFHAQRSPDNPYVVLVDVTKPVKIYTNTWGALNGSVSGEGSALPDARVTLDHGETQITGAGGEFDFGSQVPSGDHSLEIVCEGYEPQFDLPAAVQQGRTTSAPVIMDPTKRGYLRGVATNPQDMPLAGATVQLFNDGHLVASAPLTGDDGAFAFWGGFDVQDTSYTLRASRENFLDFISDPFYLKPGLPDVYNIPMKYDASYGGFEQNGAITSWVQEQTWMQSDDNTGLAILQTLLGYLSYVTGIDTFEGYSVNADWGAYDYAFWLEYADVGGQRLASRLNLSFTNQTFMAFETSGGDLALGAETALYTAERIDWIELVQVDSAGNPLGDPLWTYDGEVWYSTLSHTPEASLAIALPDLPIDSTQLHDYALRVFLTIGQYDPQSPDTSYFEHWSPPANAGNLSLMGSSSGANQQCFTWRLDNDFSHRYAVADYRSQAALLQASAAPGAATASALANDPASLAAAAPAVRLTRVGNAAVRIGQPFQVDLAVDPAAGQDLYGLEFHLNFNSAYLRLVSATPGADIAGPQGAHLVSQAPATVNASGQIVDWAVTRLAAPDGVAGGAFVRLTFVPLALTSYTKLDLNNVWLSTPDAAIFTPASTSDLTLAIEKAQVYLPMLTR